MGPARTVAAAANGSYSEMAEGAAVGGPGDSRPTGRTDTPDQLGDLPIDPDIDAAEDHRPSRRASGGPFAPLPRSRWPRIHWASVAMVGVGGFAGGLVRYGVGLGWPTPAGTFPWATFTVNTAGAFILATLLVLVLEVLPPTTYLRPALGTGFCGALTTFSSVAVSVDQLAAHGHADVAASYVIVSLVAGLAAASFGIVLGRSIAASRAKGRE